MKSQTPLRKNSRWNFSQLHLKLFFFACRTRLVKYVKSFPHSYLSQETSDVEAFHVIVGSDKEDSTKKFDQCCGEDTCCSEGTLLPRILLFVVAVLTFAGEVVYMVVYKNYHILSNFLFLPFQVGILISASIMVFWVNAFRYGSRSAPNPCCCMKTLDGHLRCVIISFAAVLCLFLGLLSFSVRRFDIDDTIADALFGLSFAVLIVGAVSVSIYLVYQIDCD